MTPTEANGVVGRTRDGADNGDLRGWADGRTIGTTRAKLTRLRCLPSTDRRHDLSAIWIYVTWSPSGTTIRFQILGIIKAAVLLRKTESLRRSSAFSARNRFTRTS